MSAALAEQHVNFGVLDSTSEYLQCECEMVYRVFPFARIVDFPAGYALVVEPPAEVGGKYRVIGPMSALLAEPDDGTMPYRHVRWACRCGRTLQYLEPLTTPVDCRACDKAALRRNKPPDYYVNPRYGQACDCCGQSGRHLVRRDGTRPPRCMQ